MLHDNYEMLYLELYNIYDMLYFKLYKKYETSCMMYYDNNILEAVLLSYDIYMIFINFAFSSYNMCDKSPQKWFEICSICCEIIFVEFVSSSNTKCITFECLSERDRICSMVYNEIKELESVSLLNLNCTTENCYQKRYKTCKFKNKTQTCYQLFYYFFFLMFLSIFECNILEYLIHCSSLKRYNYAVYWFEFEQYLHNVLLSLCNHSISRMKIKRENDKKTLPFANEYIEENDYIHSYFFAGCMHQIAGSGKIVCEYLQSCTESKVLNNSQYFKGKEFDFKDYKSLSGASNNMLETFIPLFYSKIPLEQLLNYLNMRKLQNISILHRMSIPHKADKKNF